MNRAATLIGALVFLAIAAAALYRLLFGFEITLGGMQVGQTSTFFVFVAAAALFLISLRGVRRISD